MGIAKVDSDLRPTVVCPYISMTLSQESLIFLVSLCHGQPYPLGKYRFYSPLALQSFLSSSSVEKEKKRRWKRMLYLCSTADM